MSYSFIEISRENLSTEDENRFISLSDRWIKDAPSWGGDEIVKCLQDKAYKLFFCRNTKSLELCGFALFRLGGDDSELLYMNVLSDFRRQGLGKNLLDFSAKTLKNMGINKIFLEVRPSNNAGRTLYESVGFIKVHTRKIYYKDGEDASIYEKTLA